MSKRAVKERTPLLGAHVSASGGVYHAWENSNAIGANCMQIFTANQKQWQPKAPSPADAARFRELRPNSGVQSVMSHDSYLINLCAVKPETHALSLKAFGEEIERCVALGVELLNFHPGSHCGQGVESGVKMIAAALDELAPLYRDKDLTIVLETTAGQGSAIGWRFEEIAAILKNVRDASQLGVCVDTCHIFAAGYDIRDAAVWEKTWKEFDRLIGLARLKAFHVNDSKKPLASRVDRHADIGKGELGLETFRLLVNDERFTGLPMVLETPGGPEMWQQEIALLRSLIGKKRV